MVANARADWFDEVKRAAPDIGDVAAALGMDVRGRRFGPCPECGVDDRRHPPVGITFRGEGWRCYHCQAVGDAVALVALVTVGTRRPKGMAWGEVRAVCAAQGWCSGDGERATWTPPVARPRVEAPYPERDELVRLLLACRRPMEAPELHPWFAARGWTRRLPAGVLPDVYGWPGFWPEHMRGFKLVVPMVTPDGRVTSMHGRWPSTVAPWGKTRWPKERRATGLLFSDPWVGRPYLQGGRRPDRVLVTEGITSFLSACCRTVPGTAVIGADNGGFGALPKMTGVSVFVATDCGDADGTGDRYWREAKARIPHARRVLLPGKMDVADILHPNARCSFDDLLTMVER